MKMSRSESNAQIDTDARKIANQIVFGKIEAARIMWKNATIPLMRWEMMALRDKIRAVVKELDAAKSDLESKRNGV